MSRVADAVLKNGGALGAAEPESALQEADTESWSTTAGPWHLEDAPSPAGQSSPPIGATSPAAEKAPEITAVRGRGLPDVGRASREQLAPIVQSLLHDGPADTRLRSLLFTAIGPEFSADLCASTAEALAHQTPGSVCVVDANLRSPSLHASFGVDGAPGVSDLVLQRGDLRSCVARVGRNLWLLPAGTRCAEAVPALGGEQMRRHVKGVLAAFDYVLIDTSAASARSDAVALGGLVNGVVLVVGARATRREAAKRTIDQLRAANVNVLGAILTNRDFPIPEALYRML